MSEEGAPGWMVGLSVRSADRNRPLGIGEIHALVSKSLHLGSDLDEVKAIVKDLRASAGADEQAAPADALDERVRRATESIGGG